MILMSAWQVVSQLPQPMNANVIILSAAAVGFVLNTLSVLGIARRRRRLLGRMEESLSQG